MSEFAVTIHKIIIEPVPDADRIELAHAEGEEFQMVVGKGQFKTGDLFAYIPEQAVVPDWLLAQIGLEGALDGPQHNRVKAHKFRGILSQGLAYKPPTEGYWEHSEAPAKLVDLGDSMGSWQYVRVQPDTAHHARYAPWLPGTDIAETLGIKKYEPLLPARMRGTWAPAPNHESRAGSALWRSYTHIENIKKYPRLFTEGELVAIHEKLHGTCSIYYGDREGRSAVSSLGIARRGFSLIEEPENVYWEIARQYRLHDKIQDLIRLLSLDGCMFFGETIGVQDLRYGLPPDQHAFYLFDILVKEPDQAPRWLDEPNLEAMAQTLGLDRPPLLYHGPYNLSLIQEMTKGNTLLADGPHIREGCVIRPVEERVDPRHGRVILKSINPAYLLRKGETTEFS